MVSSGRYLSYRLAVCTNMSGLWKMKGLLEMQHYSGAVQWVSWFNLCLRGSFPVPFWSLSVLMMDSCRCMCDTHTLTRSHAHTQTVESAISLFPPSFIFPGFSTRCSLCEKNGEMHTRPVWALSMLCALGEGGGCFFLEEKAILWRQFSLYFELPSLPQHIQHSRKKLLEQMAALCFLLIACFLCVFVNFAYEEISNINYVNTICCFAVTVNEWQMGLVVFVDNSPHIYFSSAKIVSDLDHCYCRA